ncbi:MAG: GDSL-type esterase/lipase family protein [Xanthobacteraceae bacterium]
MRRLRDIAINLLVAVASVLVLLALCEFVVFRYIWLAGDAPRLDFVNDVVRYAPDQHGVWRVRNRIAAPYRINKQGWNSGIGDYVRERRTKTARIAVVGDSFVEALQVANTESLSEVMGRALTKSGLPAEVYRFAISGAPLSQYVHMVEREIVGYRPDWIVVIVVHNDFDESFRFMQGRYTSSFMKFRIENGKVTGDLPPIPWRPGPIEMLRQTATARFLLYRWQVRPQALIDLLLPRPAGAAEDPWAANVEIGRVLAAHREIAAVTDHATARLAALARGIGARLLLVMDGDRQAIYRGAGSPALALNRILADAAERHGIAFLDLHPVFAAHWAAHRRRFDFDTDGHWNEQGHAIVGNAIAERIRQVR